MSSGDIEKVTFIKEIVPGSMSEEIKHFKRYMNINTWQYLIVLGIAISGIAAFVYTYEALTNINKDIANCMSSGDLGKKINTEFIVLLIVSILAIFMGILMAWSFRKRENQRRLLSLGIISIGIFGVVYSLSLKFQRASNTARLFTAWGLFIVFVLLGLFTSDRKTNPNIEFQPFQVF